MKVRRGHPQISKVDPFPICGDPQIHASWDLVLKSRRGVQVSSTIPPTLALSPANITMPDRLQ